MKKKMIIGTIVIVILGIIFSLSMIAKNKNKYKSVKTAVVSKGDIKSYLSTTGTIKSKNIKEYFGPQGKVSKINFKLGASVKKGDILVVYDIQDLNTPVKQAELQYNNAILQKQDLVNQSNQMTININDKNNKISDLTKSINDLNNQITSLNKPNNNQVSSQLDSIIKQRDSLVQQKNSLMQQRDALQPISNEKMQQADNAIKNSKLALDTAKENLAKNTGNIVSDVDGVVTAINVLEGGVGTQQQAAIVVQTINDLKVTISVGRYDIDKVKLDKSAIVKSSTNEYRGKVSKIYPVAEVSKTVASGEATIQVDVDLIENAPNLKVGFDADVDILLDEVKNVIKIPAESIKTDKNGKSFVYVVENNKAVEKEIKKEVRSETEVQVEGVNEGSRVILNPTDVIQNGTLVK
ncbi:HlyD family secretion protein [Clostridium cavendishii DSM 21758]|uniref:HlyD family secretion protein n=1 Tax=Clostridium cavendishii DSM 21758 TaxID=1121302 RepID=A0A1M6I3X5_9CLOT|nr:biotin/lipoyl-binding protein [Clostridium cavendishii]SHJ29044.1 HlyD family secretion protein [Clostridium cavendishii DSM 21758]